ncbi:hypothetical protein THAOC_23543, partial [Thalassiosira oceanica]
PGGEPPPPEPVRRLVAAADQAVEPDAARAEGEEAAPVEAPDDLLVYFRREAVEARRRFLSPSSEPDGRRRRTGPEVKHARGCAALPTRLGFGVRWVGRTQNTGLRMTKDGHHERQLDVSGQRCEREQTPTRPPLGRSLPLRIRTGRDITRTRDL